LLFAVIMSYVTSAVTYTSVYTDSEPGRAFWGADNNEGSDPEEDPEEYEDDKTEDGPADYPMNGGDDGDNDDDDSSRDDANDEDEDDDEEEEEHLASVDSTIVVPVDEPVFPPEGTEPVIPPPPIDITIGARIIVWPQTSTRGRGERLARCTAPPAHSSPLPPLPPCLYIPPPGQRSPIRLPFACPYIVDLGDILPLEGLLLVAMVVSG
ncbi:hypothetical protein Tco_0130723, partial [Tanacetum coccineum]